MNIPSNIEGLTELSAGIAQNPLAGSKFALPPGFDASRFASMWAEEGPNVIEMQQPTVLVSAGVQAAGWQVYKQLKNPANAKKEDELPLENRPKPTMERVVRVVGKTTFVLMFRPKALQQAVNVIHANESRSMVSREVHGETNAANEANDRGILTSADMARNKRVFREEDGEGYLKTTPLSATPEQAVELNLA